MLVWLLLVTVWPYLLSELFSGLYRVTTCLPYILCVSAYVQFITSVCGIKVIALLCCMALACGLIKTLVAGPVFHLYPAAVGSEHSKAALAALSLYFGSHLLRVINNYTSFSLQRAKL